MAAPVYDAVQIPPDISRGAEFGATFSTIVIETVSGAETRVSQWLVARHRGTIALEMRTPAQFAALKAFFLARTGRARGFRFKDWSDYAVVNEPLIPQPAFNAPVGSPTLQLVKTYTDGLINYVRNIYAPTASPAAVLLKNGLAFAGYTLDTTTGLVTLTALDSKATTAISPVAAVVVSHGPQPLLIAAPRRFLIAGGQTLVTETPPSRPFSRGYGDRVRQGGGAVLAPRSGSASSPVAAATLVTVGAAHGFSAGDLVYFSGVGGMTAINGLVGNVISAGTTTITVNIDSSGFAAYTSGGTAAKYLTATDTLTWTGNFDVPVRFDTDSMNGVQEDVAIASWSSIPVVELLS